MRKVGTINCLEHVSNPDAPWVILFHGFGADAGDLSPLAQAIPMKTPCNFLFPEGITEVPAGPGWTGRAWWPLDLQRVQRESQGGAEWDTSNEIPATMEQVRKRALQMIEAMNVPWNQIILGGFSQGAMLAVDLALNAPETPRGLVILSGALINKIDLKEKASRRQGLPFFQSHGDRDAVLPFKNASRLESLLTLGGLKGGLIRFSGGHEIPMAVLEKLGAYLDRQLTSK